MKFLPNRALDPFEKTFVPVAAALSDEVTNLMAESDGFLNRSRQEEESQGEATEMA